MDTEVNLITAALMAVLPKALAQLTFLAHRLREKELTAVARLLHN